MAIDTAYLIRRRKARGMFQKDLADAAGITKQSMCDIEKGRFEPTPPVLVRIAEALDVDPEALLGAEEVA